MHAEERTLLAELRAHLERERLPGLPSEWWEAPAPAEAPSPEPVAASAHVLTPDPTRGTSAPENGRGRVDDMSFDELHAEVTACRRCRLCETRTNVVFGVGLRQSPKIVFVGEGPGADEDRLGEPFVGKAGALLTAAITKGMGLRREDVYICNVVKCRPPENRAPLPDETAACSPFLYRQLELLEPQVIVTLGNPAQLALSGVQGGITKLRGKWLEWRGIKLMPTFHPAYILRNPAAKRPFWTDLQEVMRECRIESPRREAPAEDGV